MSNAKIRKREFLKRVRRASRIKKSRSYLSLFSKTELKRFARKHKYKPSTMRSSVSQRINERAREYYMSLYARKNARKISQATGQSEAQLRIGRIATRSRRYVEAQIEVPFYFTRKISRVDFDFDSEYPEASLRGIAREAIRFVRGKRFWLRFDMTIWIGKEKFTKYYNTYSVTADKKMTINELYIHMIEAITTLYGKVAEEYNLYMLTSSIEYVGELFDFPWISELSFFVYDDNR